MEPMDAADKIVEAVCVGLGLGALLVGIPAIIYVIINF